MTLSDFLDQLNSHPDQVAFADSIAVIEANYDITPCSFQNGELSNSEDSNQGSCKILAFGQINQLSKEQTLACFGHYYRDDVLGNPGGEDHGNIRNFMKFGWEGVSFDGQPLAPKA